MPDCRDVELMVQDYLDGYLLPSQREVLEAHLPGCPSCTTLLAELRRIDAGIGEIDQVEAPEGLARSILDALPPAAYAPSPWRRAAAWAGGPMLAALLLVAGFLARDRYLLESAVAAREVEVVLVAPTAVSAAVVGDFNGWDPKRNPMARSGHGGEWRARLRLPPGVHQYSFVVDGTNWVADPTASNLLEDGFGGQNSVLIVGG